ncbi:MAG: MarR family transcriptional regulator [Sphingomonas sp.]
MTPPPRTFYLINKLNSAINAQMESLLREFDLTVPQYVYLSQIRGHGSLSSSHLSRINRVSAQSISEMMRILEKRHLVGKKMSQENKRSFLISLTENGESVLSICDSLIDTLEPTIFAGINSSEHAAFRDVLERMIANARGREHRRALTNHGEVTTQAT